MATTIGIAHVNGKYQIGGGNFITAGVSQIKLTGAKAIKLFLSPVYNEHYNNGFTGTPQTLLALAQDPTLTALWQDSQLDTFFLNCFAFPNGQHDPWKFPAQIETIQTQDYVQLYDLVSWLRINTSNKTFIIQNWEGDWALLQATVASDRVADRIPERMTAWLRARQRAVDDAKAATPNATTEVLHAVEVNRVQDVWEHPNMPRVINKVLPNLKPDLISYSAYDAVFNLSIGQLNPWEANQNTLLASITNRFARAVELFNHYISSVPVYIGEWGVPENELPFGYSADTIIRHVHSLAQTYDFPYHLYWQVWDNETSAGGDNPPLDNSDLRGFWLQKFDGTTSQAYDTLSALIP